MLCRYCLEGRRNRCKSCGNDISPFWERCADCARRAAFERMRDKLIAERKRSEAPAWFRAEAIRSEQLAEKAKIEGSPPIRGRAFLKSAIRALLANAWPCGYRPS